MAEEEEVGSFLLARFGGQEELVRRCTGTLASQGITLVSHLKWVSLRDLRDLNVPLLFARRLHDEGCLSDSASLAPAKRLHPRRFYSGDAIVDFENFYHCPWPDLESILNDIEIGKWLLLTAPWQSGKTTMLTAIGVHLRARGYLVEFTTMDSTMVALANDKSKPEKAAAEEFYKRLIHNICNQSELEPPKNSCDVMEVFTAREDRKPVIWLVDEAQLLNHMHHRTGFAVYNLLSGLRMAKQQSVSKNPLGKFRLHSFCLCGLPKLANLIRGARIRRLRESQGPYVPSSPHHVEYDPLRPHYSGWESPLSKQLERTEWKLSQPQVMQMLDDYFRDRHLFCKTTFHGVEDEKHHRQAIAGISESIIGLTSGQAGLVGICCDLLQEVDREQGTAVQSLEHWQRLVDQGRVRSSAFNDTVYAKMVAAVSDYPDGVKNVILECMESVDGSAEVEDFDSVLEAIEDGVLERAGGTLKVRLSSPLLLSVLMESCSFTQLQLLPAPTQSLLEVYETAIAFMNPEVFMRSKVSNASGQPSEYIMQSQLFRGLMFIMQLRLYTPHRYQVFVEVKERDENGKRSKRMDGLMENSDAPKQGLELQVGSDSKETRKNLERCVYYGKLHGCEMMYLYFWVGKAEGDPTGAKSLMEELTLVRELQADGTEIVKVRGDYAGVTCWYVNYVSDRRAWVIHRLEENGKWVTSRKEVSPEFPRFLLSSLERRRTR